jgi:ribosomal protein S18 acetylase RimI-like enzyme
MMTILPDKILIRQLEKTDPIPYELLLDADPSKVLVDQYLADADIFIATYNNSIAGVYVLLPLNPAYIEIKNIAVVENLQGKGIGKIMLNDAFKKAREKNYKVVVIGTSSTSTGPLYLYQKVGFEVTRIIRNFFTDNYPRPLFEHGIQCMHMIVLEKIL